MSSQIQPAQQAALSIPERKGVIQRFAESYDLEPGKVLQIVARTIFRANKQEDELSNEETAAALIVCNAYQLNPFTKEIYAFRSKGKLLIVVGVDGWSTIVNRQAELNGIEFEEHFDDKGHIKAVTCMIHRKDRALPIIVTEYTHECRRETIPWQTMPIRMTRNRAFVQCARIAFSISGIIDDDEAQTIQGSPELPPAVVEGNTRTEQVKSAIRHRREKQEPSVADPTPTASEATSSASTPSSTPSQDTGPMEEKPSVPTTAPQDSAADEQKPQSDLW